MGSSVRFRFRVCQVSRILHPIEPKSNIQPWLLSLEMSQGEEKTVLGCRRRPTTYYLISDLHIGGDGGLARCEFESELVEFLADIAVGPQPARSLSSAMPSASGGANGSAKVSPRSKPSPPCTPPCFTNYAETGKQVTITLLPGNHDYDLACVPEYATEALARYNIHLEPVVHITRTIAGHTVWIEHGNQYDDFNRFPDFGNRYGLPLGYFITRGIVAGAGRSAERTKSQWLNDVQSVYPNEDIPFWVLSNHFYKEMTPVLRWGYFPSCSSSP